MFNNKKCNKCGKNIKESFDFCPYCGKSLDEKNNWGVLGKNDAPINQAPTNNSPFNMLGGGMLDKMLNNAMKMLEKEMQKNPGNIQPKTNLQLYINGKKINIQSKPGTQTQKTDQPIKKVKEIPSTYFTKEKLKKFSNLKKQEPATNVKRLSDRIIYEIEMPEVKSVKDIAITKLENSIEIKAIGKKTSYYKVIQIRLPIVDYYLNQGKLVLELTEK